MLLVIAYLFFGTAQYWREHSDKNNTITCVLQICDYIINPQNGGNYTEIHVCYLSNFISIHAWSLLFTKLMNRKTEIKF